ncbi:MAG: hypothetical protein HY235_29260 [Acidobacteria bacterium]|nr:hypothetical protein [Acidobacteriota bacterium]
MASKRVLPIIAFVFTSLGLCGRGIAQPAPQRQLYVQVYMHHYVGGGGFYPSAEDVRAFARLMQKYELPATFYFDGILVERLQEEDPAIFDYLNGLKVPLGYHAEEAHGPFPVICVSSGCVTWARNWGEALEEARQRYSHRIVPGPVDPRTKRMDLRQGGASDLTRIGGLALVREAFGRDVSIVTAHSVESAPAGYAFQQLSDFQVEQPSIPLVGLAGAVMQQYPRELIEEALTMAGANTDFFWYMNRLNYKTRPQPAQDLPFRFLEVGLTAWPPGGLAAVEEQLKQLRAQVRAVPGSRFITPGELPGFFEPPNARPILQDELRSLAEKLVARWKGGPPDFVDLGTRSYSLVNAWEALAQALAYYGANGQLPKSVSTSALFGPIARPEEIASLKATIKAPLEGLCTAASAALEQASHLDPRRVPIRTVVGDVELNPAEFLVAMARAFLALAGGAEPAAVNVDPSSTLPPYADVLERFFKPADSRPLCYTKLQLWTVKPAVVKTENGEAKTRR